MASEYSDFKTVDVVDNDIAVLPLDAPVTAFQYRKTLVLEVPSFLFDGGVSFKDLTWDFTFCVRENRDPNSRILFQSETRWTARITALQDPFGGGLSLLTWQPLGDAGAGKTTTTVIEGEPIKPEEAWRYVDKTNPTVNDGQGYTIFTPEGVASIGTYYFFAEWYSAQWKQTLQPGNALDANDATSLGNISDEATYAISVKAGFPRVAARFDNFGGLLGTYDWKGNAGAALGYEPYADLGKRGYVEKGQSFSIEEDLWGRVWQLVKESGGWFAHISYDGARTFNRYGDTAIWPKEVTQADMIIDDDGSRLSVGVVGKEVAFTRVRDDEATTLPVGTLERAQAVTLVKRDGKLMVMGDDEILFVSTSHGATWVPRGNSAEQIAAEDTALVGAI